MKGKARSDAAGSHSPASSRSSKPAAASSSAADLTLRILEDGLTKREFFGAASNSAWMALWQEKTEVVTLHSSSRANTARQRASRSLQPTSRHRVPSTICTGAHNRAHCGVTEGCSHPQSLGRRSVEDAGAFLEVLQQTLAGLRILADLGVVVSWGQVNREKNGHCPGRGHLVESEERPRHGPHWRTGLEDAAQPPIDKGGEVRTSLQSSRLRELHSRGEQAEGGQGGRVRE